MTLCSKTSEISKENKMETIKWEIKGYDTFGQSEINSMSEEFPLADGSALKITLMAMSPKSVCILEYSGQKECSRKIGKLVLESEGWTESFDYVYGTPMKVEFPSLPSDWLRVTVTPHLSVERVGYAAEVPIGAETSKSASAVSSLPSTADCGTSTELARLSAAPTEIQPLLSSTSEASPSDAVLALSSADPATVSPTEPQEADSTNSRLNTAPEKAHSADPESNHKPEPEALNSVQPPQDTLIVRVTKFIMEATAQLLIAVSKSDKAFPTEAQLQETLHQLEIECEHSDEDPILLKKAKEALSKLNNSPRETPLIPPHEVLEIGRFFSPGTSHGWERLETIVGTLGNRWWKTTELRTQVCDIIWMAVKMSNHIRRCKKDCGHESIARGIRVQVKILLYHAFYFQRMEGKLREAQNELYEVYWWWTSKWLDLFEFIITNREYLRCVQREIEDCDCYSYDWKL